VLSPAGTKEVAQTRLLSLEAPSLQHAWGTARARRGLLVRRALAIADLVGLTFAFLLALVDYGSRSTSTNTFSVAWESVLFVATLPGWLLLAKLNGLYDRDEEHAAHTTVDDLIGIVKVVTIGSWLLFVTTWFTRVASPYPPKLIVFWSLAIIFVVVARLAARAFCRRRASFIQNAIVVGGGETAQLLARTFRTRTDYGVNLVGYVDAEATRDAGVTYLGHVERLPELVEQHGIERVIIEFPTLPRERTTDVVRELRRRDVQVDIIPRLYELLAPGADVHMVEGLPMMGLPPIRAERTLRTLKRGFDIVGAAIGLILLAPLFGWIALCIKLDSSGPVFYRHERIGEGGRTFRLIKFRTMNVGAAKQFDEVMQDPERRAEFERTQKFLDDPRVTLVGRILRRLSIDELPQLVNVLVGHMSLVGPRPVTNAEVTRYEPDADTLLTVRPGVTGYWQINGRSDTAWEDRVRLDLSYIHGWSLKLDFLILGKTFWVLLTGRGAY
jgi:exopolysaccharide biosynthesis polyprenyl glycosylphosphotransferase